MPLFPHDVYANQLLSHDGYPLWFPEPYAELPDIYQNDGLQIGDVGIIIPENGGFDVLFNLTLPLSHPLHQQRGVPDDFNPILLSDSDLAVVPDKFQPGHVISSQSFDKEGHIRNLMVIPDGGCSRCELHPTSSEGALLILPDGAESKDLLNTQRFVGEAKRHATDWYDFAQQHLGRIIGDDSLFVVTGYHKARSWVAVSFQGATHGSAVVKVKRVEGGNIAASCMSRGGWPIEWRAGPADEFGNANQTVFIRGLKVTVADELFGTLRRITVRGADSHDALASEVLASDLVVGAWPAMLYKNILSRTFPTWQTAAEWSKSRHRKGAIWLTPYDHLGRLARLGYLSISLFTRFEHLRPGRAFRLPFSERECHGTSFSTSANRSQHPACLPEIPYQTPSH